MKERIRLSLLFVYQLLDLLALTTAIGLAFYYGSTTGIGYIWQFFLAPTVDSAIFLGGTIITWGFVLSSMWLYHSKRLATLSDELWDVLRGVAFCTVVLATLILLSGWEIVPKRFLLIFAATAFVLMGLLRVLKRSILHQFRLHGRNLRSVVIIGAGPRGQKIYDLIKENPNFGYRFIGFVDDLDVPHNLGKLSDVGRILAENVVDEVFLCLPVKTFYNEMDAIARTAEDQGITVRLPSDLFNLRLARAVSGNIADNPILSLYAAPQNGWQMLAKNAFDFTGALILTVLLTPLLLLIALLIKLTSPGPVFFVQQRVGYNKRFFKMFKFRTMVVNAEALQKSLENLNEVDGPVFKIKNDPRITPIGRFLRKTSLDELPQLINVLLGDLSLVGPRPLPLRDFERFDELWFNRRFSVKPGITCLWQISGRSDTNFDSWIMQDLEYIDKWSLALDFSILVKTIPVVLRGTGAM